MYCPHRVHLLGACVQLTLINTLKKTSQEVKGHLLSLVVKGHHLFLEVKGHHLPTHKVDIAILKI